MAATVAPAPVGIAGRCYPAIGSDIPTGSAIRSRGRCYPAIGSDIPTGSAIRSRGRCYPAIGSDIPTGAAIRGRGGGASAIRPRAAWRIACEARVVGIVRDQRHAGVGLLAQRHRQRDRGEQRYVELLGERAAAARAEDLEALAGRRDEGGHVLDHSRDLERELGRHLGGASRDPLRRGLRRRHDHERRLRQKLGQRHRDVAGSRREVDQQEVELPPGDVLEELLERLVQHRPAPDDRGVLLDEEADRHHADAAGRKRDDLAFRRDRGALGAEAQHPRDRVAPHVGVEHADAAALGAQRRREVGGQRRLPDAALSGSDADDVLHRGHRARRQLADPELRAQRGLLGVVEDVEVDAHRAHALERHHGVVHRALEVPADRAAGGRQRHGDGDVAVGPASIRRTMSSSTIERCSSGSMTARSASRISSVVGIAVFSQTVPGGPHAPRIQPPMSSTWRSRSQKPSER